MVVTETRTYIHPETGCASTIDDAGAVGVMLRERAARGQAYWRKMLLEGNMQALRVVHLPSACSLILSHDGPDQIGRTRSPRVRSALHLSMGPLTKQGKRASQAYYKHRFGWDVGTFTREGRDALVEGVFGSGEGHRIWVEKAESRTGRLLGVWHFWVYYGEAGIGTHPGPLNLWVEECQELEERGLVTFNTLREMERQGQGQGADHAPNGEGPCPVKYVMAELSCSPPRTARTWSSICGRYARSIRPRPKRHSPSPAR